jgi:hypothetical protein
MCFVAVDLVATSQSYFRHLPVLFRFLGIRHWLRRNEADCRTHRRQHDYLLRLGEVNGYATPYTILSLAGLGRRTTKAMERLQVEHLLIDPLVLQVRIITGCTHIGHAFRGALTGQQPARGRHDPCHLVEHPSNILHRQRAPDQQVTRAFILSGRESDDNRLALISRNSFMN